MSLVRGTWMLAEVATSNQEGWRQIGELFLALALSSIIGLEREYRQKSAGLRTHTLVGVGAALFMLISKYGFNDVLGSHVIVDPSRVAAQIVTGIGFIGAGIIFVRQGSVRGLTTAAGVWMTAAVGAASGAGLPLLAIATTGVYLLVVLGFPLLVRYLPHPSETEAVIRVRYPDGHGVLRHILQLVTSRGFTLGAVSTETVDQRHPDWVAEGAPSAAVEVTMRVRGNGSVHELVAALSDLAFVNAIVTDEENTGFE